MLKKLYYTITGRGGKGSSHHNNLLSFQYKLQYILGGSSAHPCIFYRDAAPPGPLAPRDLVTHACVG